MAYIKKDNYPSLKKPGVYPDGSIKELGLDSDNLEKFSLGNWSELDENKKQLWFGLPPNEVIQVDEEDTINPFNLAYETNITVEEAKSQDFQIYNYNDNTYLLTMSSVGSFILFSPMASRRVRRPSEFSGAIGLFFSFRSSISRISCSISLRIFSFKYFFFFLSIFITLFNSIN